MTKTSAAVAVVALLAGYLLGNFAPLQKFSTTGNPASVDDRKDENSQPASIPNGKGLLEVAVTNPSGAPMVGIEVDVAVQPGPPESWGTKEADVNGKAAFELAPGTYYVYFNMNRFPSGYKVPSELKVEVQAGQTKKVAIVLERN